MDKPTLDSPSVQSYLSFLQALIGRMAGNSSSCKTWCITIVSAILVVVADKGNPLYVWIAAIPVVLFFGLDTYYLALERDFIEQYNIFIRKMHADTAELDDVFIIKSAKGRDFLKTLFGALCSLAVFPFYLVLLATVEVARRVIM